MEKKKEIDSTYKKHIDKLVKPIWDKKFKELGQENNVPKETQFNHSMVGHNIKKIVTPSLYNPHNYRLYFNFTKEKYNPKEGMVGVWFGKFKNYGKEFTALGEGVRVTVKKTKAEIINKLTEQEWFLVNRAKAKEEIIAILNKIDSKCIASFKKFIELYGGCSDFAILKREGRPGLNLFTKSDNKVIREPFIDTLPSEMTFETPIVKKVYKHPSEVEFKEPIYAAHHLENSALYEFAPEIAKEINSVNEVLQGDLKPVLKALTEQIKLHLEVQRETKDTMKDIRNFIVKKPKTKKQTSPYLLKHINDKGELHIP